MLTPLQARIAGLIVDLPEASEFALAGGAALIAHGLVDRTTSDLDYFCTDGRSIAPLRERLAAVLTDAELSMTLLESSESFARLRVTDGDDETLVDLASDYRLRPSVETRFGPTLTIEELAADKLLALFDRAEARDFVDVYRLSDTVGFPRMIELARAKDEGFSTRFFAEMLGTFGRHDRAEFEVDNRTYQELDGWVQELRRELGADGSLGREPPGLEL